MMTDYEIKQCFKRIRQVELSHSQQTLIKGLRIWYKKTGGLSEKQITVLKNIYQSIECLT